MEEIGRGDELTLQRDPFTKTRLDEEKAQDRGKTSGVWFNNQELIALEEIAVFFHQEKESTTIKHCVELAKAIIEGKPLEVAVRDIVFNNVRKNKRMGIEEVAPRFRIS